MRRREFLGVLGGAAVWPIAAHTQERVRRVGILMQTAADEPESQARVAAFLQGLQEAGWSVGRNVQIEYRWASDDRVRLRTAAAELVALKPDVILAGVGPTPQVVQQATHTVPIVFAQAIDPVGIGVVDSLARPGTNATGFTQFEYSLSGKWVELLREVAPKVTRAVVVREALGYAGIGQWAVIQSVASPIGMEVRPIDLRNTGEAERRVATFARSANDGLIVTVSSIATTHSNLLIALAARHRLPAVYPYRFYVTAGGLLSYGPDLIGPYRRAAGYVDRILNGEKPADLPVQNPTKYELAVNLKTAKALGLTLPPSLLARADEVIE